MAETRQVTQIKTFFLALNPMQDRAESRICVAFSDDKDKLIAWHNSHLAPKPFNTTEGDKTWKHSFRQDSALAWMNPIDTQNFLLNRHGHGISEEWVNEDDFVKIDYYIKV